MNPRFLNTLVALAGLGWIFLAAPLSYGASGFVLANLAAANNADGRLEVFSINPKGELRHRWQRESTHDWSSWSSLGGTFLPGLAVANDAAGRLAVLAVDQATQLVEFNCQQSPNSPAWLAWTALPGPRAESPVVVCANANGTLEVFAVAAADHAVKHTWQTGAAGGWAAWVDMGAALEPGLQVARNKAGQSKFLASGPATGAWFISGK